jgi:hypothetical protein
MARAVRSNIERLVPEFDSTRNSSALGQGPCSTVNDKDPVRSFILYGAPPVYVIEPDGMQPFGSYDVTPIDWAGLVAALIRL